MEKTGLNYKEFVGFLYQAARFFYPLVVFGPDEATSYPTGDIFRYQGRVITRKEFRETIFSLFPETGDIGEAINKLSQLTQLSEQQLAQTLPPDLEKLLVESEARKWQEEAAKQKAEVDTEKFVAELKRRKIKVVPVEEIPVFTLNSGEKEKLYTLGMAAKIDPGTAQQQFENIIKQSLEKSAPEIKEKVAPQTITKAAVDLTDRVKPFGEYEKASEIPNKIPSIHPASLIATIAMLNDAKLKGLITEEKAREILVKNAQALALAIEAERNVNSTLANAVFPESAATINMLYGPDQITQFTIADDQETEEGIEVDIKEVIDQGRYIRDIWQKLATRTTTVEEVATTTSTFVTTYTPSTTLAISSQASSLLVKALPVVGGIYGLKQGILLSNWAALRTPLLMSPQVAGWLTAGGGIQNIVAASNVISSKVLFNVSLGKFSVTIGTASGKGMQAIVAGARFGEKFFAAAAARASTGAAVATISSKAGIKVLSSALFAKIGAVLGSWGTPILAAIGAAIGWLVGKLVEKLPRIWQWLKENAPVMAIALLGAGLFFQMPLLIGIGAVGLLGAGLAALSGARLASGLGGFFGGFRFLFTGIIGPAVIGPLIAILIGLPILVAFILFVINSGAYLVPPKPISDVPFEPSIECTTEKAPVSFPNLTSSPIAKRAWEITADLYQGFWCFWNRSPGDFPEDKTEYPHSYPELFDKGLFVRNPNPTREQISICGECLFWCTWLVQKAYRENGVSIEYTLWSPTMQADFTRRGKFISASQSTPANVVPGSVVFFDVVNSLDRTDHVGIAHSINVDGVSFAQSNAGTKDGFIPFNSSGVGLQNIPGITVVGVGIP